MKESYSFHYLIAHTGGKAQALRDRLRQWGAKEIIPNIWILNGDWTAEVTRAQLAETAGPEAAIIVVALRDGCDYATVGATPAGLSELRRFGAPGRGL
jgi:hypothetical protein